MGTIVCSREELNQMRWQIYRLLPPLKQRLSIFYQELVEKDMSWANNIWAELRTMIDALYSCTVLFDLPPQMADKYEAVKSEVAAGRTETTERELLLVNMFELMDNIEECVRTKIKRCNVCKNEIFFTPIPTGYETMRKKYGFLYWQADFQLESKKNFKCPVCGAFDRERLMIAFLEEVRAEDGEKLRMLHVAPSRAMERYALGREDILYESTDLLLEDVTFQADLQHMDPVENETYDIIVCSHVLEHVENDALAMRELYRILKPDGVCLVLVPLIVGKMDTEEQWGCDEEENWRRFGQNDHSRLYGKKDFIMRLQDAGFYVNELGKEWFGEAFYQEYGFDDLSIMYVATKEIKLVEQGEEELQAGEMAELQAENRLLRMAIDNLSNRLAELEKTSRANFERFLGSTPLN